MQKQPLPFGSSKSTSPSTLGKSSVANDVTANNVLAVGELEHLAREWLFDCEYRQHSKSTLANRRLYLDKLIWFLESRNDTHCSLSQLRHFFAYLTTGHEKVGGRWGSEDTSQHRRCHFAYKPLRPSTVATYHRHIKAFFNWCVREEFLEVSPMTRIAPPVARADQIQPFTLEQVRSLILASKRTRNAERDQTIVRVLVDTGMRASELCSLKMEQLDLFGQRAIILGKGNKHRTVHFGSKTARMLRTYLKDEHRTPAETLIQADKNQYAGQPLTPNGLRQIIENLGKLAGLQAVRCSPHTLRHTFAVEFLRNGGDVFSLKEILGHSSLHMTNRYVALAQADIEKQQRRFAPGDRLGV